MRGRRTIHWFCFTSIFAFFAWLAFVGNFSSQELVLGAASALCAAGMCVVTWKKMNLLIAFRMIDVAQGCRVPLYIAQGACQVVLVLAKDLAGRSRGSWVLCAVPFERRTDRYGVLRRVLAVAYTTASPSSIVIGIDENERLMLAHHVAPCHVTEMEEKLGAQP